MTKISSVTPYSYELVSRNWFGTVGDGVPSESSTGAGLPGYSELGSAPQFCEHKESLFFWASVFLPV